MDQVRDGRKRVVLYARVSTRRQAQDGFSLDQQIDRLREYAAEQGYEIIEECRDPGYSGTVLERPGLERVRELVTSGGVDIVLAQDRDRFSREPAYHYLLKREFEEYGTVLRALNDRGDDSPESELTDGILDQIAKFERAKITQRARRNKRKKALEGKVVGGHPAAYGYRYTDSGDSYEVHEPTMRVVRRIFEDLAAGDSIRTVKERLDSAHIETPNGGEVWSRPFIKHLILRDLYRPHTIEQLSELGVSETVLAALDTNATYGVYRYDGIPVPVPDAGLDSATVEAARGYVLSNRASQRSPSRAAKRTWELSGGILRCGECGRAMQPEVPRPRGTAYFYYRCAGAKEGGADRCSFREYFRAEEIEAEVWDSVRSVYDDKALLEQNIREAFALKRRELSTPVASVEELTRQLNRLEQKWLRWLRAYDKEAITVEELKAYRIEIEEEREGIERTLEQARNLSTELKAQRARKRLCWPL